MGPLRHSVAALAAVLALPVGAIGCALRPTWRRGLRERLGGMPAVDTGALWIHAASVGETRAAATLLPGLRDREMPLLLSHSSVGGRALDDAELAGIPRCFAPLDHPWCVAAALGAARPRALVLIETELWPCWIAEASRRSVPVVVLSGRVSDRSLARYRRARPLMARTFGRLVAVGARSAEDAARFAELGTPETRIEVTGDLKYDAPCSLAPLADDLRAVLGRGRYWVAGSTHANEERAVAAAQRALVEGGTGFSLVVAPRRPDRAAAVQQELVQAGLRVRLRSRLGSAPLAPDEVLLVDSVGELRALYGLARFAFVGGTLAKVGGHNVLEPVQAGVAVLFGPELSEVRETAGQLEGCGAGVLVEDAQALGERVVEWATKPDRLRVRAEAGQAFVRAQRGSAARSLALLERSGALAPRARSGD